jgi:hypothetical protein
MNMRDTCSSHAITADHAVRSLKLYVELFQAHPDINRG